MLLAFAPFVAFAVLNHFVDPTIALAVAAVVSIVLTGRELGMGRSAKILEVGTAILFAGLAIVSYLSTAPWPVMQVKLAVDLGLALIVLVSLIIGKPFTLQYAEENSPEQIWDTPQFKKANAMITTVWLGAFAALVVADLVFLYMPDVPHRMSVLLSIGALYAAFKFTQNYPDRPKKV